MSNFNFFPRYLLVRFFPPLHKNCSGQYVDDCTRIANLAYDLTSVSAEFFCLAFTETCLKFGLC